VARRFASKEVVVVSNKNQGAAAARNHALQFSQGEYIQWLHADYILALDKIELRNATFALNLLTFKQCLAVIATRYRLWGNH